MSKYSYKARDKNGQLVEDVIFAESVKESITELNNKGLIVVSIEKIKETAEEKKASRTKAKKKKRNISGRGRAISLNDIAVFCRQLATMIGAGISIAEAVDNIAQMAENPSFGNVLRKIVDDILVGMALSDALSKYPKVFDRVFVSMTQAGEASGHLDTVLLDLADYLESTMKLRRKVKAASMYPLFIAGFTSLVLCALILFVVPKFKSLFATLGADLPGPTKIVVAISDTIIGNLHWAALSTVALIIMLILLLKINIVRYHVDNLKLNLPIFGKLIGKVILARFFRTLSTLLQTGVDIVTSLEIAGNVVNNLPYEKCVAEIRKKITKGTQLSIEMAAFSLFTKMSVKMTTVGEKTGKIPEMLTKVAEYYTDEVDTAVDGLSAMIEPVLIVFLGLIVGIFVVTMYLPVFKMATAMMGGGV